MQIMNQNNVVAEHCRVLRLEANMFNVISELQKIKLINLIKCQYFYIEKNECILVQEDLRSNSLAKILHDLSLQQKRSLVTQLFITYKELERRGLKYCYSLGKLYYSESILYVSVLDFDFKNEMKNVQQKVYEISQCLCGNTLSIEQYLEQQFPNQLSEECQYLWFIMETFQLSSVKGIPGFNSYIYISERPNIFDELVDTRNIIIKSAKLDDFGNSMNSVDDYLQKSSDRELQINEILDSNRYATCFGYYRILQQSFLFYEQYPLTLQESNIQQSQQNRIIYQLALDLNELHKTYQIIHRDLKPSNIFLTSHDSVKAHARIADFNRARSLDNCVNQQLTHLGNSYDYDPPESGTTNYNYKSDVWQFGLIAYQILNNNIYPFQRQSKIISKDEYKTEFTKQKIQQKLNRNDILTELISQCLNYDINERIELSYFIKQMNELIDQDSQLPSTNNLIRQIQKIKKYIQKQKKKVEFKEIPQLIGDNMNNI